MRPLLGVVTQTGRTLTIRLESGLVIETPDNHAFGKYDKVDVLYDFTKSIIVSVEAHRRHDEKQEDLDEPVQATLDSGEVEDDPPVIDDRFGALIPVCDEMWDEASGLLLSELYDFQ